MQNPSGHQGPKGFQGVFYWILPYHNKVVLPAAANEILEQLMEPFLYRCPVLGLLVQAINDRAVRPPDYQTVSCTACGRLHLVRPDTGEVMGLADDD